MGMGLGDGGNWGFGRVDGPKKLGYFRAILSFSGQIVPMWLCYFY